MVIIFVFIAIFHFLSHFVFLSMKMHIRKYLIFKEQGLFPIPNFEMLHIFIGCSSLHQPLALLSEVAVSTVTGIAVVGIRVRRTLAVSVAKTAIAVAQTAIAVSSVSTAVAVVSISLRVSRPLDQAPVESPGGAPLFRGVVWSHRVLSDDKSSASNGGSTVSPPSIPGLGLSLSRPLFLAETVDEVLSVSAEEGAIPVDNQRGSPASKTSQAVAGQTKTRVSDECHVLLL